jgi:hypothetical protein
VADGWRFRLGEPLTMNGVPSGARHLPRYGGRALIADKRNDENVIVSQLHGLFLRFHNAVAAAPAHSGLGFVGVQRLVRWHYQRVVLNDYLPRAVGRETLHAVLPHLESGRSILEDRPRLLFYHFNNEPFIPVEFSAAAFRFGHSMVRSIYRLNADRTRRAARGGRGGSRRTPLHLLGRRGSVARRLRRVPTDVGHRLAALLRGRRPAHARRHARSRASARPAVTY